MRFAPLVACALLSCGGDARPPKPVDARPKNAPVAPPPDPLPSFADLEARAAEEAPLMRAVERVTGPYEVRAERDLCFRGVFVAAAPVRVYFLDDEGALRGNAGEGASGTVPPEGPACARKGERLRLVTTAHTDTAFRVLVLRAP